MLVTMAMEVANPDTVVVEPRESDSVNAGPICTSPVAPEDDAPPKMSERSRRTKIGHAVAEIASAVPLAHPKQDKATILENAVMYLEYFNKNVTNVDQFNQEFTQALKSGAVVIEPLSNPVPSKATTSPKKVIKRPRTAKSPAAPRGTRSKGAPKKIRSEEDPSESSNPDTVATTSVVVDQVNDAPTSPREIIDVATGTDIPIDDPVLNAPIPPADPAKANDEEPDPSNGPKLTIDVQIEI